MCVLLVFFFKQKTAYEMRISDWSSDVCSSDLFGAVQFDQGIIDLAAGESGHQMLKGADGNAGRVRQAGAQLRIRDVFVARGGFGMFPREGAPPEDDAAFRGRRVPPHEGTPARKTADETGRASGLGRVGKSVLSSGGAG